MDSVIIFLAKDLIVFIIILAFVTWYKLSPKLKKESVLSLLFTLLAAIILTKIAGALYYHPRPFIVEHIQPLIPHGSDNGFPSEHTVLGASLTALIYFYNKKLAAAALILTIAMGAGRVWAHVHSPIDILGGLVIGAVAGWAGYQIARRAKLGRKAS
jgi:undecaprenyl-diphosphatase